MALSSNASRESGFIGRQQELAALTVALHTALSGRGQMVVLAGEPGIGKTRIARELATYAEGKGVRVLWGWCYERQGAPPYWPWLQAIRSYIEQCGHRELLVDLGPGAGDIAQIIPELFQKLPGLQPPTPVAPDQARFRRFFSMTAFLKNISRRQPLVLVLDDLQWADESSLLLLEFLAREIPADSIMVLGTYRDVEVTGGHPLAQTLGSLVREENFQRIQMTGLSQEEVGEFVEACAGVVIEDAAAQTLHQRTKGNPLFVREVVSSVSPEEIGRDQDWIASIPEAIREAISRRLSRLSPRCNQLLRTASVIGRDFDLPLLRSLSADLSEDEFLDGLDEAFSIRIVETIPERPGRYHFGHALIQQALYEEIPPIRRAQSHGAVAEALEELHQRDLDEHAGELAHHFAEAQAALGAERLARYSLMAGERALAANAYQEAAGFFMRGLAAKGMETDGPTIPDDEEGAALLFGLARAPANTNVDDQLVRSFGAIRRSFEYYAAAGNVARAVDVAEFPIGPPTGRVPGVAQLLARALTLVPSDSHEAGRLLSRHGGILGLANGDYEGAQRALEQATAIARREGDVALEVQTLAYAADVSGNHLRWQESVDNGLKAIDLATGNENPYSQVLPRWWTVVSMLHMGDLEAARVHASVLRDLTERPSTPRFLAWLSSVPIAFLSCIEGDWEGGRKYTESAIGMSPLSQQIIGIRTLLEFETGEYAQGEEYLERLYEALSLKADANFSTGRTCMAIASIARITGITTRLEIAESAAESVVLTPAVTPTLALYAKAALAMLAVQKGDKTKSAEHYAHLQGQRRTMLWTAITIDRLLGLLSQTMGDLDQAEAHFEDALAFCRKAGYMPELAWTCHDYAEALMAGAGGAVPLRPSKATAADLLEEALAISSDIGMRPLVERVTILKYTLGARPAARPGYPDGITQREVEVLRLVAAGKTDREIAGELIISVNTVGNHVRSILNKTNTANRTEAAAYAALRGLTNAN